MTDLIAELADKWNAKASELYNCQMHDAASVYETCADELRAHAVEIEAMARDAARYRKVRMGRSDWHGDVYAMTFAGCGDFPVCGDDLDVLADAMHDSAREGGNG